MVTKLRGSRKNIKSYANALRITAVVFTLFLLTVQSLQFNVVFVDGVSKLQEKEKWNDTGNVLLDSMVKFVQSTKLYYFVKKETLASNYGVTIGDGKKDNLIDFSDKQTVFHLFLLFTAEALAFFSLVSMFFTGHSGSTMLKEDKLRSNNILGADLEDEENEQRPMVNGQMTAKQRAKIAKLPKSTNHHQGVLATRRNFFIFFIFASLTLEIFRWRSVYSDMQDALVLKYGDEYLLWRDVFINGVSAEDAIDKSVERNRNPNNKQATLKKGDLTTFDSLPD